MELMGRENDAGDEGETQNRSTCHGAVTAVIGDGGSTQSLVVARFLGVVHVPQVSNARNSGNNKKVNQLDPEMYIKKSRRDLEFSL